MLPEKNIPSLNEYFEQNGLQNFLYYPKNALVIDDGLGIQTNSDDAALASTNEVIDHYVRSLIAYINKHIGRMPFDDTIEDWMSFDSSNPTPSHATVSSGFTLIHAEKRGELDTKPESQIEDWFEQYDNSGVNGTFAQKTLSLPNN